MITVNSSPKKKLWAAAIQWLAASTALIYVLVQFFPGAPALVATIDGGWTQALHVAFEQRWKFGRDIVFTYGPWGFLSGGYYPPTFFISVVAWTLLAVVFWWAGWRTARHFSNNIFFSWLWLAGIAGVTSISGGQCFDIRSIAWVMMLLFLHFFVEEKPVTARQALLAVSLGLFSLVKFTSFLESLIVVGVIAADDVFRRRRFPWIAAIFSASFVFFWIAAGQRLSLLWPFLLHSWQISDGYGEAMQLGTNAFDAAGIVSFLLEALVLVVMTGCAGWQRHGRFGIFPAAGLGAILLLTFKHGFARSDSLHETTASLAMLVAALICMAVTWPFLQRKKVWSGPASLLLLTGILFLSSFTFSGWFPEDSLLGQFARTFSIHNLLIPVKTLAHPEQLREIYGQDLAAIRKQFQIPPIEGEADIYPWNQMAFFAHGLQYHPRPVIQSYTAYTPELAELNAQWLRSDRAAANILFEIDPLNGRFPSLEDGLSWPELLTRYDLADTNGTFFLLKRATVPREFHLTLLKETTVQFGETIALPGATSSPVWAEIEINKSIFGNFIAAIYKPAILRLKISLRDGEQLYFRLVPGMARGGFLLSPLIADKKSFAWLAAADGWRNLSGFEVTSMSISAATSSGSTLCYQRTIKLRLYRLDFQRQDLEGTKIHLSK
jgi:hypothetical protein